ncbi:argininosuccinate lyase [Paenarthrobacter histidinolovorans]|uniref:argininosuccinate lyase n=1 Tax=Paenarthrobacter histidinolovorans TaxID=43664 RepID=UPI001662B79D|nr:argininosuccinate lyase [Paenarthrobacter histidinolovorans]GGJ40298.1 argininosuccinate lyase [Paenarthrobacter histidinolovorans]
MRATLTDGRLGARPSAALVEHVNGLELTDELAGAEEYVLMDIAHAVMLTHQRIFTEDHGRALVTALLGLLDKGPRAILAGDPEIGTITLQIERYLEDQCGPGGLDIQRARSRIDQKATGWRLINRKAFLTVMAELIVLGETLLDAAEHYDSVLIPGYTHLQHSQPSTLGHYFNAHYWAVSRNLSRLEQAYERLNESPLGGAAYSGTSWPIDREATASYLGFDRPIPNARDAGAAATDMGAELAATLGLALSGISRLASDLYYWSSTEVGLVRIHPSLCGTSSMMPQKRNPMVFERIRGLAGSAVGWSASQLGVMHTSTSTDVDQCYVHNLIPGYCQETTGAITLLTEAIATLEVNVEAMKASAGRHWSTASALADDLALSHGLSFRPAHDLVARFVTAHETSDVPDGTLNPELGEAPLQHYSAQRLSSVLDPEAFVESRISRGGTSKVRRQELAAEAGTDLEAHRRLVDSLAAHLLQARERLLHDAALIAADGTEHTP